MHAKLYSLFSFLVLSCSIVDLLAQSCQSECFDTLDAAQDCFRMCTNTAELLDGTIATFGSNRLWQCTNVYTSFSDVVACCDMDASCQTITTDAQACAANGCIDPCIKSTSYDYLTCIKTESSAGNCLFAGFACMGQLFNLPDLNEDSGLAVEGTYVFDFEEDLKAAAQNVTTTTCEPLDPFVSGICSIGGSCCAGCTAKMGALADCLVNKFVLPMVSKEKAISPSLACEVNTTECSLGGPVANNTTTVASSQGTLTLGNQDLNASTTATIGDLDLSKCEEALTKNFLVHNVTFASGQYVECVTKGMAIILANEELQDSAAVALGSLTWLVVAAVVIMSAAGAIIV